MVASADLVVNIVTKLSGDGMAQAEKSTSKFKSGLASASKVAGVALVAVGAAAIGAANAAAEDAQSQALLAKSMENAAGSTKSQIAQTEDWIDAQSKATGVTDDELRPALGTLVRATGDVTKSQKALQTAMDISAATGKPLASVTDAMAKGFGGNTSALSRLVPGISQAALKSKDFARIMKEVGDKTKGSAAASAETAAGKMKRFKNALGETQEAAGAALLPVLGKLSGILVIISQWAQDHGTLFTIVAAGIGIMAAAIVALNVGLSIYNTITAITAVVSASAWAATLGPILLVVGAVLLVVGAIVILWKKSQTFRNIVLGVWAAIKTGAAAVGRFLVSMWQKVSAGAQGFARVARAVWSAISATGRAVATVVRVIWRTVFAGITAYLRAYAAVFHAVFAAIRTVVSTTVGWVKDRWQALWDSLRSLARGFQDVMAQVWAAVRSGAQKVAAPFTAIADAIQHVIDLVGNLIGALGRIHVPSIKLPHIPGMHSAAAPAVAGVSTYAAPGVAGARAGTGGATAGWGGTVINVYGAVDPEGTARQVRRILAGHDRRVGLRVS